VTQTETREPFERRVQRQRTQCVAVTSAQCASGPVAVRHGPAFRPWDTDTGSPEARVAYREMTMRAGRSAAKRWCFPSASRARIEINQQRRNVIRDQSHQQTNHRRILARKRPNDNRITSRRAGVRRGARPPCALRDREAGAGRPLWAYSDQCGFHATRITHSITVPITL
jgi:hypothetical protein